MLTVVADTQSTIPTTTVTGALADAADRVHRAECALHAARQADVDSWVAAAYSRLHEALEAYRAALGGGVLAA